MTKYYTNKPDFSGDPTYPLVSSDSYFKSMSSIMDDIEAAGKVVTDEGVEDLYSGSEGIATDGYELEGGIAGVIKGAETLSFCGIM